MQAYTCGITKEAFVAEIRKHMKADHFIKGTYSDGRKGCAVGCSLKSVNKLKNKRISVSDHKAYEKHLGIPEWLARLEDTLFENLSLERSKVWPLEFSEAINEGADLEKIKVPFIVFMLENNIKIQEKSLEQELPKDVRHCINEVINVNKIMILAQKTGDGIGDAVSAAWSAVSAARSAEYAAWSAEYAAVSAARSAEYAAVSAVSAAWSAVSAARSAEYAAVSAEYAARYAARSAEYAAYEMYADELLKLLRGCA